VSAFAPAAVYLLCLATSLVCAVLLIRAYRGSRSRLLLWTALCFVFLALNNLFLVADMVIFPNIDFRIWRHLAAFAAIGVLLFGFIREAE
jgi:hypothetical protein